METKKIKIGEIKPHPKNPKGHEIELIAKSIEEMGYIEPIVVDENDVILAGHGRLKALKELKKEDVEVIVKRGLTEKQKEKYLLLSNKLTEMGGWNDDLLKDFDVDVLNDVGFDAKHLLRLYNLNNENEEVNHLSDEFIVNPFSVFEIYKDFWIDRKKEWLSLGIKSGEGRKKSLLGTAVLMRSVNEGTSIFNPVICEICYKWFCTKGGLILDPFAGGCVRGVVAKYLGYDYLGIDLSKDQVEENRRQAKNIFKDGDKPEWVIGNGLDVDTLCKERSDFIFSCPPYFDLEQYSDNQEDLSNLDWDEFTVQYKKIIRKSVENLKDDRFACFVVGDVRDKDGYYRDFIGLTKNAFVESGAQLYNEIIIVNTVGTLAMRARVQFNSNRKVGKQHQNILIFYKGDISKIRKNFGVFKEKAGDIITN